MANGRAETFCEVSALFSICSQKHIFTNSMIYEFSSKYTQAQLYWHTYHILKFNMILKGYK